MTRGDLTAIRSNVSVTPNCCGYHCRTAPSQPASNPDALAGIRPETRLRKLHLVRPDLIPYPIAYEVYC